MNIEEMRRLCRAGATQWTNHVMMRLIQRSISTSDVEYAILNGEIIEEYPDDTPYPSGLVLGIIQRGPLHVVCGVAPERLWIITAYWPDLSEWEPDFKHRKGRS